MAAVQPIQEIQHAEHKLNYVHTEEVTVKDVWTSFFFDEKKLLCFQILLQTECGKMALFQELKDYTGYKNTLKELQAMRSGNVVIKIPKKSVIPVRALEKWHGFRKG